MAQGIDYTIHKKTRLQSQPGTIQDGKILVIRIRSGSSMENIQIIQGYKVFLDRNIMARHPPVTPRGP